MSIAWKLVGPFKRGADPAGTGSAKAMKPAASTKRLVFSQRLTGERADQRNMGNLLIC
jgi:hypothetical protein